MTDEVNENIHHYFCDEKESARSKHKNNTNNNTACSRTRCFTEAKKADSNNNTLRNRHQTNKLTCHIKQS